MYKLSVFPRVPLQRFPCFGDKLKKAQPKLCQEIPSRSILESFLFLFVFDVNPSFINKKERGFDRKH